MYIYKYSHLSLLYKAYNPITKISAMNNPQRCVKYSDDCFSEFTQFLYLSIDSHSLRESHSPSICGQQPV